LKVSRYIHLNLARLRRLGLGKREMQRSRLVGVERVDEEQVQERIRTLRCFPWSSYRAYIGSAKRPAWLAVGAVLRLAGKGANPGERYRQHCEAAIRQGLVESPWDKLIGQAVLGSQRFAARLAASLARDDSTRRKLSKRPGLEEGHRRSGGSARREMGSVSQSLWRCGAGFGIAFGKDGLRDEHSGTEPAGGHRVYECGYGAETLFGASAGGSRHREASPTSNEQIA